MKTRATLLLLWVSLGLWAQAPDNFKYQAVLRDASGNVKANTATTIVLSLLEGSVSGTPVYTETHAVTTNEFGLVNLTVGNGTNKIGNLGTIDWSANSYFLNVKVDGTDFGTSQLMSVPYALYAKTAGNGFSGNYNDLTNKPAAATVTETGLMSATDKTKLEGIAAGAEVNVNADWTATTGDGLILNKPVLFSGSFADLINKPTTIIGYGITDAFSGSYSDLTNKPTLFDGTWYSLTGKPTFATVATSGSYNDLLNKPTLFSGAFADLTGKPTTIIGYGITDAYTKTNLQTSGEAQLHWLNLTSKPNLLDEDGSNDVLLTGNQTINGTKTFSSLLAAASNLTVAGTSTLTGNLTVNSTASIAGNVTMQGSVSVGNQLTIGNGLSITTGGINMNNNNRITNLLDPTANQEAATKKYVDDRDVNDVTLNTTQTVSGSKTFSSEIVATNGISSSIAGTTGNALYVNASSATGGTNAVYARNVSSSGIALQALVNSTSGTTYGVRSTVMSPDGFAGFFAGGKNYFGGNVGIGTTTPRTALDVNGEGNFIEVNATDRIGVGTMSPRTPLDVRGDASVEGLEVYGDALLRGNSWAASSFKVGGSTTSVVILEIRQLVGTVDCVTSLDWAEITLPSGWTNSNTRILSANVLTSNGNLRGVNYYIDTDNIIHLDACGIAGVDGAGIRIVMMKIQ